MLRFLTPRRGSRRLLASLALSGLLVALSVSSLSCAKHEPDSKTDPGIVFVKAGETVTAPWEGVLLRMDKFFELSHD